MQVLNKAGLHLTERHELSSSCVQQKMSVTGGKTVLVA